MACAHFFLLKVPACVLWKARAAVEDVTMGRGASHRNRKQIAVTFCILLFRLTLWSAVLTVLGPPSSLFHNKTDEH